MGNSGCHICASRQAPLPLLGAEDARLVDRREFLWRFGGGLGGIAMAHLLGQQGLLAETAAPRAEWNGDLVPNLGSCADDMAFIHSMVSKSNVHGPATFMQNTGFVLPGFPSMGAWISFGLGSLTDNLPTFVVLPDPRGFAPNGPANWGSGFLPAAHQGTMIRVGKPNPILDLFPPDSAGLITQDSEREGLALLQKFNREHQAAHPGDSRLEARIGSFELAA